IEIVTAGVAAIGDNDEVEVFAVAISGEFQRFQPMDRGEIARGEFLSVPVQAFAYLSAAALLRNAGSVEKQGPALFDFTAKHNIAFVDRESLQTAGPLKHGLVAGRVEYHPCTVNARRDRAAGRNALIFAVVELIRRSLWRNQRRAEGDGCKQQRYEAGGGLSQNISGGDDHGSTIWWEKFSFATIPIKSLVLIDGYATQR
ncbi:MAG: hypothetical protein O6909_00405, partial [Alphaproteobacteria bacterium]|nr:hypothetical protein [Alphaproteobacteria bacterium]